MRKKTIFRILIICIFFITNCVNVFANTVAYGYNKVNVVISFIMKAVILIIALAYIIFLYTCLKRAKEDQLKITKKLIIWLIIAIIISIGLWFGAQAVLEAGKTIINPPRFVDT